MATLPEPWAAYARLQTGLSRRTELDDYTWGLEAGLNVIFDPAFPASTCEDDFLRAVSTAARKERDHAQRFFTVSSEDQDAEDPRNFEDWIAARSVIAAIAARVRAADHKLLFSLGMGHSYEEISAQQGETATNLRSRALRLRLALARLYNQTEVRPIPGSVQRGVPV